MKVVHVLKRIETIDNDIKELRKIEKSIASNKSFSTPLYLSIEHQINLLLGERVKLFELKIANPPAELDRESSDKEEADFKPLLGKTKKTKHKRDPGMTAASKSPVRKTIKPKSETGPENTEDDDDLPFKMLTQDQIDKNIDSIKAGGDSEDNADDKMESVKVLDIALEKGNIDRKEVKKVQEKRKIRFFRDNFPGSDN